MGSIVCVTDTAFMSTSLDEATSIFYLSKPHAGRPRGVGLLWELRAGSEDDHAFHCGADVSMLSQFGAEREVLFPPLTMLRALPRDADSTLLRVGVQLGGVKDKVERPTQGWPNLSRAQYLSSVPGVKAQREKVTCLWRAVADLLIHARAVVEHTKRVHAVTYERSEGGHPFVRVCVQPNFTGIDEGGKAEHDFREVSFT